MQIRYYTYSKNVLNKVVRHTTEAEPVADWLYVHKEQPDQWGRIELLIKYTQKSPRKKRNKQKADF